MKGVLSGLESETLVLVKVFVPVLGNRGGKAGQVWHKDSRRFHIFSRAVYLLGSRPLWTEDWFSGRLLLTAATLLLRTEES